MENADLNVRNDPLAAQAYQALRSSIISCTLAPGEKLKLGTLQKAHKFSSSPLREALNRLVAEGLVTNDERKGFRAASMSVADLADLTLCRTVEEANAFELSVRHGDDAWEAEVVASFHRLEKLERQINQGKAARDDKWTELHKAFHVTLISACGSERLIRSCENHFDQSERYRRLSAKVRGQARNTVSEHKALMECVLNRTPEKARKLLIEHIEKTSANVARYLAKNAL